MALVNCAVNLDLNWSKNCVIVASNSDQETTFSVTDNCSSCNNCNSYNFMNKRSCKAA